MIFWIFSTFIAIIILVVVWFIREITQYGFTEDVSKGHAVPHLKLGLELAFSSQGLKEKFKI